MSEKYIAYNPETALFVGNMDPDGNLTWTIDDRLAGVFLEDEVPLLKEKGLTIISLDKGMNLD